MNLGKMDFISYLPTPVFNKVLKLLSFKDKLTIRLLNKHLKTLIDDYQPIWRDTCVKIDIINQNTLVNGIEFMKKFHRIHNLSLNCPKQLILSEDSLRYCTHLMRNFEIHLFVSVIDVNSLEMLNIFSTGCIELQIRLFSRTINTIESIGSLQKQLAMTNKPLIKMERLEKLSIAFDFENLNKEMKIPNWISLVTCDFNDSIDDLDNYLVENDPFNEHLLAMPNYNPIQFNEQISADIINSFQLNKCNLKELVLWDYSGGSYTMLKLLNNLYLNSIKLKLLNPSIYQDYYDSIDSSLLSFKNFKFISKSVELDDVSSDFVAKLFSGCVNQEFIEKLIVNDNPHSVESDKTLEIIYNNQQNLINLKQFDVNQEKLLQR